MIRKKSDEKRRKQKKKKNSAKGKSGQELLKEKVQKAWNIPKEKIMTSQKGVEKMSEVILEFPQTLRQIVDMLIKRKRMHFIDNKKLIVDYQFSISRNKRRLYVVSTQSPC